MSQKTPTVQDYDTQVAKNLVEARISKKKKKNDNNFCTAKTVKKKIPQEESWEKKNRASAFYIQELFSVIKISSRTSCGAPKKLTHAQLYGEKDNPCCCVLWEKMNF